jgi:hypothetical protein
MRESLTAASGFDLAFAAVLADVARLGEIGIAFPRPAGEFFAVRAEFVENELGSAFHRQYFW